LDLPELDLPPHEQRRSFRFGEAGAGRRTGHGPIVRRRRERGEVRRDSFLEFSETRALFGPRARSRGGSRFAEFWHASANELRGS
jgi:hypothetical protein